MSKITNDGLSSGRQRVNYIPGTLCDDQWWDDSDWYDFLYDLPKCLASSNVAAVLVDKTNNTAQIAPQW